MVVGALANRRLLLSCKERVNGRISQDDLGSPSILPTPLSLNFPTLTSCLHRCLDSSVDRGHSTFSPPPPGCGKLPAQPRDRSLLSDLD